MVSDIFLALKAIQAIMEAVENMVDSDAVTPEFLDARDAVRQKLVDMANEM